jgi:hypothetical protein
MANARRERYAELVNAYLRAKLVTTDFGGFPVFNTRYEGDPKAGSVKTPVRSEIALSDYNSASGVGDTSFVTLAIDKDKAVNEIIDGFDAAAVPADFVADRLESAAYKLAQTLDADGIAALIGAATAKTYYTRRRRILRNSRRRDRAYRRRRSARRAVADCKTVNLWLVA